MQSRSILAAIIVCLAFIECSALDVVTQPYRKYGLGDLHKVAISPDGRWMATSGAAGAFIWNYTNGTMLHRLEAHHSQVLALCFSPDSEVLLTGGFDRMIRAWDVQTGEEMLSFQGHVWEITDLKFAPDGESFVSAGDNTARIWSLDKDEPLQTLSVVGTSISRAVFAPDGKHLVTVDASFTNCVKLWDLSTEQVVRSFGGRVVSMVFAGTNLVTGGEDFAVQVWDIENGQTLHSLVGATHVVLDVVNATNNSSVTAACMDGRIITWDMETEIVQHNFLGEPLVAMAAVNGTNQVVVAHSGRLVRLKNSQSGDNLRAFGGHTTSTTLGVGFSSDGRYVVSGGTEALTRMWIRSNALAHFLLLGGGAGTEAARFSPDGTHILTTHGAPFFSAKLWVAETGLLEREFFGHTSWPLAAVFSPDGQRIATGAQDGTARLWDVASGTLIRTFTSPGVWIRAVAVSSNGTMLASGTTDGQAHVWNTANGQLIRSFQLNAGAVMALDFSPKTGDLLVAWADGFIRLFDPVTGELKLDSVAPAAFLNDAAFSPDGRFILGGEGWPFFTARLWDASNGENLRVFAGHAGPVDSIAFNASGTSILTGSDIVRAWSIADIAARLESQTKSNGVELRWSIGTLQRAEELVGPWTDVTNATSPRLISTSGPSEFFRVRTQSDE